MNTSNNLRDSDCAGFYYWPPLWIGTPPIEQGADLSPALMNAEVFSSHFACGVRLKVSKQGLFVFDFAHWELGSAALAQDPLANWEERVFARMRFMNLFLACLYTSRLRIQGQVPSCLSTTQHTSLPDHSLSIRGTCSATCARRRSSELPKNGISSSSRPV